MKTQQTMTAVLQSRNERARVEAREAGNIALAQRDYFSLSTPERPDYSHHEYKDIDVRNLTRGQLIESYCDSKSHAERLAEALKIAQRFIAKLEKLDVVEVNSNSGLDWDTRFVIREALAQWEQH